MSCPNGSKISFYTQAHHARRALTTLVILNFIGCGLLPKGAVSVLRSKPLFQNWPGNQVRQIAHCSEEELLRQKNCLLVIYVSLQYPSLLLLFSLLHHLEKLDFSSVSTEAGHEPIDTTGSSLVKVAFGLQHIMFEFLALVDGHESKAAYDYTSPKSYISLTCLKYCKSRSQLVKVTTDISSPNLL